MRRNSLYRLYIGVILVLGVTLSAMGALAQDEPDGATGMSSIHLPFVVVSGGGTGSTPTTTQSPATATSTQSPALSATPTSTILATNTISPSPTATSTSSQPLTPSQTPTFGPSTTPTNTPTNTPTATASPTPTATPCGQLSGVLSASVTLQSGCTYVVPSSVLVSEAVTLTIPAGVTLRFDADKYMRVDGALIVNGSETSPVLFTKNTNGMWTGIRIADSSGQRSSISSLIIEYANGNGSSVRVFSALFVDSSRPTLTNITVRYSGEAIILEPDGDLTLLGGHIHDNVGGVHLSGASVIDGVRIERNVCCGSQLPVTLEVCAGSTVKNSWIVDNELVAIYASACGGGFTAITGNLVSGNGGAFATEFFGTILLSNNVIVNNSKVQGGNASYIEDAKGPLHFGCNVAMTGNNITDNSTDFAVGVSRYARDCDIDATDNWWGTANSSDIAALIYDYYDDFELGRVVFEPFEAAPIPDIGPD